MPDYGQEFQYVSDALKDVYAPVMKSNPQDFAVI